MERHHVERDTAPLLSAHGAAFGYRKHVILRDVELEIRPGERIGVLGPNGSGKSTLFLGLLGLIPTLEGRVESARARFGYVPQHERLDPVFPLAVREIAEMGACARAGWGRRLPREERELVRESLARVGMLEHADALFARLSGGQRQRVLVARALAMRPNVLLLDEPTSGVDRAAQERIEALLCELAEVEGLAVLLVSHQLASLRRIAADLLWVARGRVERGAAESMLTPERLESLFGGTA